MAGVVVGMSRAGTSRAAVHWASEAAELRRLPLTLVHAWNAPVHVTVSLDPQSLPELMGAAASVAVPGSAPAALLAGQPELLVLGGHPGARHLSHTTRTCLQRATCPVVVVPDTDRSPTGRIAVGVCGTDASNAALRWAGREAQLRHTDLLVCHAWQVHPHSVQDILIPAHAVPAQQQAAREHLRQWVEQVLGPLQVEVQLTHGGPLDGLLQAGTRADLIVVGQSVHPGLGRLLHSAVSDDLSGLAPCPVAVIPRTLSATAATLA